MNSRTESPNLRTRRALLVGLFLAGLLFAVVIVATTSVPLSSDLIVWTIGPQFLFGAASQALRWTIIKERRRLFLLGRYPLVLGGVKLGGLIGVATLLLLFVVGLVVGGSFSQRAFDALIRGMIAFAVMSMIANGLFSLLIVGRQLRGTLLESSRESRL